MNRPEHANAYSPASLPRIWGSSALLALLISLVETTLRLQSPVFECSSADFSQLALLFVCGSIFWTLLQLPVVFLIFLRKKIRNLISRVFLATVAGFYLYLLFLVIAASWYFYVTRGIFLTSGLLKFAFANSAALPLHFMQTGLSFFFLLNGISAILAIAVLGISSAEFSCSGKMAGKMAILTVVELVVAFACILTFSHASLWGNTHPVLAYWYQPEALKLPAAQISKLKSELKPKTDAIAYSPAMIQATHPVFVIMVESMRRDLVNVNPCPIPFMKSLIKESVFFDKAYATASHSNYADISVWYSQYPLRGGKSDRYTLSDPWRGTSIFKVFHQLGYKTAYISSQNEKWGTMGNWLKIPEVDYYFDSENYKGKTWVNEDDKAGLVALMKQKIATAGKIEDSATLEIGENWITAQPDLTRIFVGFNLQNTHFSYVIPEGGEEPYQPGKLDFPTVYAAWPKNRVPVVKNRFYNAFLNVDNMICQFAGFLKEKGIWDQCYFIIVGDSGEAFYEHGAANHSGPMYDEQIRTFCLIKPPKTTRPSSIVQKSISHIDIFPALLDLMKVSDPHSFQGISPFSGNRRSVYMHSKALIQQDGIIQWPWKLLLTWYPNRVELFNMEKDPLEKHNLYWKNKEKANELRLQLMKWRSDQLAYYNSPELYENYWPPAAQSAAE
ncbi:MAG: sulfatase-like hydrolase/transferase, partial [Holophagae bacterium]|nr:sulfatase-like hydrolase/transferase [Holophagae bacterium]